MRKRTKRSERSKLQIRLAVADIMFVTGIFLLVAAHGITQMAFWMLATPTADITVKQVAQAYESNPVAVDLISSTTGISRMISYIFMPALMLSVYYMARKKHIKMDNTSLIFMGAIIFFMGILNVSNDLGSLLGVMFSKGLI